MSDKNTVAVLEAAIAKNPLALKEALDAALADRVSAAIESLKASMFSEGKDEDCDDDDEDKGSDKKAEKSDEDDDDDDEELDEAVIDFVLDSILEAAEEAGVDLSEEELVELSKDTLKAYVKKADKPRKNSPHGSPEDRGAADSYYGRPRNPSGEGRKPHQHAAYHAGYNKDRRAKFVNKAKDKIYKV